MLRNQQETTVCSQEDSGEERSENSGGHRMLALLGHGSYGILLQVRQETIRDIKGF